MLCNGSFNAFYQKLPKAEDWAKMFPLDKFLQNFIFGYASITKKALEPIHNYLTLKNTKMTITQQVLEILRKSILVAESHSQHIE